MNSRYTDFTLYDFDGDVETVIASLQTAVNHAREDGWTNLKFEHIVEYGYDSYGTGNVPEEHYIVLFGDPPSKPEVKKKSRRI